MDKLDKNDLQKIFSGVSKEKLEEAVKKAEMLSKNPEVRDFVSNISEAQVKDMLGSFSTGEGQKTIAQLKNGENGELAELIKSLKSRL